MIESALSFQYFSREQYVEIDEPVCFKFHTFFNIVLTKNIWTLHYPLPHPKSG